MKCIIVLAALITLRLHQSTGQQTSGVEPHVQVTLLVRNKAETGVLPYFLSYFEDLAYDKQKISLWIRSDHNEDNSIEVLQTWLNRVKFLYHSVNIEVDAKYGLRENETSHLHWSDSRFDAVIKMKEESLNFARTEAWADYVFFLDADVLLTEPQTLNYLVNLNLPIVAPMLMSDGLYSNFWCGMTDKYYYQRTDEYKTILNNEKTGEFDVPMVHSAVLVDLKGVGSDMLTFNRDVLNEKQEKLGKKLYDDLPLDDIIVFAVSARFAQISVYISNALKFGYITVPVDEGENVYRDVQQLTNIKMLIINDLAGLNLKTDLQKFALNPAGTTLTLDKIFMINLARREDRRHKMESIFFELGLVVEHFPAVDGRLLNEDSLKELGIEFLPGYYDPYHKRPMTMGEIGCFLSHYYIWEKIVENKLDEVLVLEDDIKFESYFNEQTERLLKEARELGGWDLIYFGRKRLQETEEPWVKYSDFMVEAGYSYWTLGYVITLQGAKKLLDAKPLKKMLPVDEFLPIMFGKHPNSTWSSFYEKKNLVAWSAAPLLLYPTHYTGEDGYVSDTEDSVQVDVPYFDIDPQIGEHVHKKSDRGLTFEKLDPILAAKDEL